MATIAAGALMASGALAQPGNGKGQGNERGGGPPAKAEKGPKADRGGGPRMRGNPRDDGGVEKTRGNRGNAAARNDDNAKRKAGADGRAQVERGQSGRNRDAGPPARGNGQSASRGASRAFESARRYEDGGRDFDLFREYDRALGAYDGCPPGLAKKYNGCTPPGLARQRASYSPSFFGYSGFGGGPFYYDDGYLLRLGEGGLISAAIPLLGGALGIGNTWPSYYQPVELRPYYRDYYGLEPNGYRYANNTIYRVDPQTAAIQSVAALLTGDEFVVGQPAPRGYDIYNVPYRYRDQYVDGPDGYYRYSDGYVYRMDPETRLVAAAIELALN
ncbi:hypothetical protein ELI_01655 [Erythrobacter litoralis HTCC2594]|uniref:Uncharacterized protein n=2 Tax=Erythrobacter litoralis TaxID=39960 RepID=Q2ND18_ERYLH|nr:hypothetical protein ELI_01655 [Erythrobacter litoralis HTCC2594]